MNRIIGYGISEFHGLAGFARIFPYSPYSLFADSEPKQNEMQHARNLLIHLPVLPVPLVTQTYVNLCLPIATPILDCDL